MWFTLKQRKRFLGSVDQWPVECEQLCTGAPREYQARHRLSRGSFLRQLAAQVAELNRLTARKLIKTHL